MGKNESLDTTKSIREKLGKLVSSENEENWWRSELFEQNTRKQLPSELEVLSSPPADTENYNCFVYALGLQNERGLLGMPGWEYTRNLGPVFDRLIAEGKLLKKDQPKNGSLIVYRAADGDISHVGLIDEGGKVVSKWSWGPLIRHAIEHVPDHYGDKIEFYQIAPEAIEEVKAGHQNN